ncbi:MAG: hypothetical protein AAFO80_08735 [Pseudomonadota bacterium]
MQRFFTLILAALTLSAGLATQATACSPRLNIFAERPAPDGAYHYVIGRLVDMRVAERVGTGANGKRLTGPFVRFRATWLTEAYEGRLVGHRIGPNGAEPVDKPFRASGQGEFSRHDTFMSRTADTRMFEVNATTDTYVASFGPCEYGTLITKDPELTQRVSHCMTGGPCEWRHNLN